MPIESFEFLKLLMGIVLITIPGYFWSYTFSKHLTFCERIAFGFTISLAFFAISTYVINVLLDLSLTPNTILILYILYALPAILLYLINFLYNGLPSLNFKLVIKPKTILLILILGFTAIITFLPHITNQYYLPFHVDEWIHWSYTQSVIRSQSTSFINPYTGQGIISNMEIGFHTASASILSLTQTSLLTLFLFMPTFLMMALSIVAYNIGERSTKPFGLEAAFFVAFIPTTTQSLGPSFYVASTLGLLLLLFNIWIIQQKKPALIMLLIPITWSLFIIHPPTAFITIIIIFIYALFLGIYKSKIPAIYTTICGFIITLPAIILYMIPTRWQYGMDALFQGFISAEYLQDFMIRVELEHLGILTWILFIVGIYYSYTKGRSLKLTLCFSLIALLSIIGLYSIISYGVPIIYQRAFLYLFLLVTLIASIGFNGIRKSLSTFIIKKTPPQYNKWKKHLRTLVPILMVLLLIGTIVPAHINIPYYKMINESDYETFIWIRGNIDGYHHDNQSYATAAVNPVKASPFSAITGLYIYTSSMHPRIHPDKSSEMYLFLNNQCNDTSFLEKYNINIVYGTCDNTNLTSIYPQVYLYPKPDI